MREGIDDYLRLVAGRSAVPSGLVRVSGIGPGVETPGYFQMSLRDKKYGADAKGIYHKQFQGRAAARPYPNNEGEFDVGRICGRIQAVGDRNEEEVPSDLIASHMWEAVLFFDNPIGNRLATNETQIKHGFGNDLEQGNRRAGARIQDRRKAEVVKSCKKACWRREIGPKFGNGVVLNYTYLHAFTRFYTRCLALALTQERLKME